jgi:tetratricopeptide (TPR) repeat protein
MNKKIILVLFCLISACATIESPRKDPPIETQGSRITPEIADAAYLRSDWDESEQLYIELVSLFPYNAQYWYRLGNIYSSTNKIQAAIVAYNQSLTLDPASATTWFNLGMAQLKQSAYSFNALQSRVTQDEPLNERAGKILEGIMKILE